MRRKIVLFIIKISSNLSWFKFKILLLRNLGKENI